MKLLFFCVTEKTFKDTGSAKSSHKSLKSIEGQVQVGNDFILLLEICSFMLHTVCCDSLLTSFSRLQKS